MKETVSINILGQTIQLRSDTSTAETLQVAEFVKKTIDDLGRDRTVDTINLAIMALMNVSGAYLRLQNEVAEEGRQVEEGLQRCLDRIDAA